MSAGSTACTWRGAGCRVSRARKHNTTSRRPANGATAAPSGSIAASMTMPANEAERMNGAQFVLVEGEHWDESDTRERACNLFRPAFVRDCYQDCRAPPRETQHPFPPFLPWPRTILAQAALTIQTETECLRNVHTVDTHRAPAHTNASRHFCRPRGSVSRRRPGSPPQLLPSCFEVVNEISSCQASVAMLPCARPVLRSVGLFGCAGAQEGHSTLVQAKRSVSLHGGCFGEQKSIAKPGRCLRARPAARYGWCRVRGRHRLE